MTLSAKRLGERCGLTAEEMNFLLKVEGYLSGEPGDYYLAEKGKQFVVEKGNANGYGGYAFRGWNWLEWDISRYSGCLIAFSLLPESVYL